MTSKSFPRMSAATVDSNWGIRASQAKLNGNWRFSTIIMNEGAEQAFKFASAHDRRGEEAEAIPFYRRALALGLDGENRKGALLGLGSSLRNVGQAAEAVELLQPVGRVAGSISTAP